MIEIKIQRKKTNTGHRMLGLPFLFVIAGFIYFFVQHVNKHPYYSQEPPQVQHLPAAYQLHNPLFAFTDFVQLHREKLGLSRAYTLEGLRYLSLTIQQIAQQQQDAVLEKDSRALNKQIEKLQKKYRHDIAGIRKIFVQCADLLLMMEQKHFPQLQQVNKLQQLSRHIEAVNNLYLPKNDVQQFFAQSSYIVQYMAEQPPAKAITKK